MQAGGNRSREGVPCPDRQKGPATTDACENSRDEGEVKPGYD